jgi:hypothetical protein
VHAAALRIIVLSPRAVAPVRVSDTTLPSIVLVPIRNRLESHRETEKHEEKPKSSVPLCEAFATCSRTMLCKVE